MITAMAIRWHFIKWIYPWNFQKKNILVLLIMFAYRLVQSIFNLGAKSKCVFFVKDSLKGKFQAGINPFLKRHLMPIHSFMKNAIIFFLL